MNQMFAPQAASIDVSPHVEFRDVSKSYDGQTRVVEHLNLSVRKGEFLTLLGPSGSGKTTSLMMLAGFEAVTEGQLFMEDRPLNTLPPYKRNIGVVFQNYALFPHMSVSENIAFPLNVRGVASVEKKQRIDAALDMVRLSGFGDRKPANLSGGQQQRVALARAMVFQPSLVLLDEPLGALDRQLREQMQYELKRIHDELGVTMIYVTHDQSEALTMSDRIAIFNQGVIQQLGQPQELYGSPSNLFVASFIGENNFLRVRVEDVADGFVTISGPDVQAARSRSRRALSVGDEVTLAVRPERLRVGAAAEQCANTISARLVSATFLGDQIRLTAQTAGNATLIVKHSLVGEFAPPPVDSALQIGFQPEDAILLEPLAEQAQAN